MILLSLRILTSAIGLIFVWFVWKWLRRYHELRRELVDARDPEFSPNRSVYGGLNREAFPSELHPKLERFEVMRYRDSLIIGVVGFALAVVVRAVWFGGEP